MSNLGTESSSSHERAVAALRARVLHRQSQWATSARRRLPRRRASPVIAAIRRGASRVAHAVLRSPGLAAWGVTGAALAAFIVAGWIPRLWEVDADALALDDLRCRVRAAIQDVRRELGFHLVIPSVEVRPLEPHVRAMYSYSTRSVAFNEDIVYADDELLHISGHECVHALIHQAGLYPTSNELDFWTCALVEETAAYVLGAHIAGRVRSRRGGDGQALADLLVRDYRRDCDAVDPASMHQWMWRRITRFGEEAISLEEEIAISVHFSTTDLVDEVDAICRSSREPFAAAKAIAGRYWPTPTPTPDP